MFEIIRNNEWLNILKLRLHYFPTDQYKYIVSLINEKKDNFTITLLFTLFFFSISIFPIFPKNKFFHESLKEKRKEIETISDYHHWARYYSFNFRIASKRWVSHPSLSLSLGSTQGVGEREREGGGGGDQDPAIPGDRSTYMMPDGWARFGSIAHWTHIRGTKSPTMHSRARWQRGWW